MFPILEKWYGQAKYYNQIFKSYIFCHQFLNKTLRPKNLGDKLHQISELGMVHIIIPLLTNPERTRRFPVRNRQRRTTSNICWIELLKRSQWLTRNINQKFRGFDWIFLNDHLKRSLRMAQDTIKVFKILFAKKALKTEMWKFSHTAVLSIGTECCRISTGVKWYGCGTYLLRFTNI